MSVAKVMSDVDRKLLKETRKRITYYRSEKENNMFDTFYHSHLDFMEMCLTFYEESFLPEETQIENLGLALVGNWECFHTANTSTQLYINDDGMGELVDIDEMNYIVKFKWTLKNGRIVTDTDLVNTLLDTNSFHEVENVDERPTNKFYRM